MSVRFPRDVSRGGVSTTVICLPQTNSCCREMEIRNGTGDVRRNTVLYLSSFLLHTFNESIQTLCTYSSLTLRTTTQHSILEVTSSHFLMRGSTSSSKGPTDIQRDVVYKVLLSLRCSSLSRCAVTRKRGGATTVPFSPGDADDALHESL